MGHIRVMTAITAGALALSIGATAAQACSCQKEYMIKKYGTISALGTGEAPATPAAPSTGTPPAEPQSGG